jgi:hypothetical protein
VSLFKSEPSLKVTFYLRGGQEVTTTGVKELSTTKARDGGFASYSIEWHEGKKPVFFSLTLDHISAIVAVKE